MNHKARGQVISTGLTHEFFVFDGGLLIWDSLYRSECGHLVIFHMFLIFQKICSPDNGKGTGEQTETHTVS